MIEQKDNTFLPSYPPTEPVIPGLEKPHSAAGSLTARTFQGLKWSYLDTGINAVLQIGYTAVMARLLSPADFGLVTMANVVLRFGSYFAQMGVGAALVQKKNLSQEDIRAGFTSNILLAVLMFVLIWAAAPLSVYLFKNPEIIAIVRWLALSFILSGLSTTAVSLLRRNLAFRSLALIDIISFIIGYGGFGIIMALNGFGVYSLVGASLSQSAILAILSYIFIRHNVTFIFEWKYFKQLYGFGGRVSIISFMEFISSNLDTMVIGHFLGNVALGFYNRAYMLVNLPMQYLVTSFSRVLMPSYSQIQDQTLRLKKAYLTSIMLVASILIPACWGLSVAAREVVLIVLGEKWIASIPILKILAIAVPFNMLTYLSGSLLEALAELNIKILIQISNILLLLALFFFLGKFGVLGYAFSLVICQSVIFIAYLFVTKKRMQIKSRELLQVYMPSIYATIIICILIFGMSYFMGQAHIPITIILITEIAISGVILILLFMVAPFQKFLRKEVVNRFLQSNGEISKNPIISKIVEMLYSHH